MSTQVSPMDYNHMQISESDDKRIIIQRMLSTKKAKIVHNIELLHTLRLLSHTYFYIALINNSSIGYIKLSNKKI